MKFSGVITIDRSDVHAKDQGRRSKVKVSEVKTNFVPSWAFPNHNSSLNSLMATIWCTKLELAKKSYPIVFQGHLSNFKVPRDKKTPILTQAGCLRIVTQVCITNGYEMMHNAWSSIAEVPKINHQISRSHRTKKIADFDPNWAFPDCNPSLNSVMAL